MTTGLIICGALGREVTDIVNKHGWDADIIGVPAIDHVFPERIAPHVEQRILALREQYKRLIVVYGDCGSKGALDEMLNRFPNIERIAGPHCYEMYGGELFNDLLEEQPGTYILTDFMVRTFQGLIIKSMGLDRFPQLRETYFKNYKRIVYLAQTDDPEYRKKVHEISGYLGLPVEIRFSGYGLLESRLVEMMNELK
ncbi:MAG: DUF1638 domain-containing protein [Anaerolineales bacterium]|nr:DUF1638 domain-containing protein [Chloroflexota bacterium]MBL6983011.1 DUF1638 domain-containing protein [Anaerolineales bacterium]